MSQTEKFIDLETHLEFLKSSCENIGDRWKCYLRMKNYLKIMMSPQYKGIFSQKDIEQINSMVLFHHNEMSSVIDAITEGLEKCKEKYSLKRKLIVEMFEDIALDDQCTEYFKNELENDVRTINMIKSFLID